MKKFVDAFDGQCGCERGGAGLEDFKGGFAEVAVLEINLVEGFGCEVVDSAKGVAEGGPADVEGFVLAAGEWLAGEPGGGDGDGAFLQQAEVFGEDADFFEFATVGGDGGAGLGEILE